MENPNMLISAIPGYCIASNSGKRLGKRVAGSLSLYSTKMFITKNIIPLNTTLP